MCQNGKSLMYFFFTAVLLIIVIKKEFSRFLYQVSQLKPTTLMYSKTFKSDFLGIEVTFTDQNSNLLEIENKLDVTLAIALHKFIT